MPMWYLKADHWVGQRLQDAYLWVFDRSGVYLGTVGMIIMAMVSSIDLMTAKMTFHKWLAIATFGINGLTFYWMYSRQHKKEYTLHNLMAEYFFQAKIRHYFTLFFVAILVSYLATANFWQVLSCTLYTIIMYTTVLKLRDREPKDWFKAREPNLELAESRISG